jgi:hypothetical protein
METEVTNNSSTEVGTKTEAKATETELTELQTQLEATKAELSKNQELLSKVRRFEKENKEAGEKAKLEQGKFKEMYEETQSKLPTVEAKLKDNALNGILTQQLTEAGAKSISTVMKLVDKSKVVFNDQMEVDPSSVKIIVDELKKSDPILFGEPDKVEETKVQEKIDVKRATDSSVLGGYEKEIKLAKTHNDIMAVMKKYGKIS